MEQDKNERLSPNVHGMLLSQFFSTLFGYREKVYIFPCLNSEKHKELTRQIEESHEIMYETLHGRELIYIDRDRLFKKTPWSFAKKVLEPFVRTAGSDDARLITKLNDYVDLGYDIFFSINPLSFNTRSKRTVLRAQHILLESDSDPLAFQEQIFNQYQDSISALVHTGNKSIHAIVKVSPTLPNPHCFGWKNRDKLAVSMTNNKAVSSLQWAQYDYLANYWIEEMASKNLTLDKEVALDWSRLSRVPGFEHSKTGQPAKIIYLNADADPPHSNTIIRKMYWRYDMAPLVMGVMGKGEGKDEMHGSFLDNVEPLLEMDVIDGQDNGGVVGVEAVEAEAHSSIKDTPLCHSDNNPILSSLIESQTTSKIKVQEKIKFQVCPERGTGMTNVTPFYNHPTFLDDLETYKTLKLNGIPARHLRRTYHGAMLTVQKVFLWDEDRLGKEWRHILSIHPTHTEGDLETNVKDLLKDCRKRGLAPIYLPATSSLPDIGKEHKRQFVRNLADRECQEPQLAFRLVKNVVWNFMRTLPLECQKGTLGIHSVAIMRACRPKPYRATLTWLHDKGIVVCMNPNYSQGGQTRKYFINIPLILYLFGFRKEELVWDKGIGGGKRGSIWKAA